MKKKKTLTAAEIGRKGGEATFKKLGVEHYRRIATIRYSKSKVKPKKD